MIQLFHESSYACSRRVTELYSTSFTLGIKALHPTFKDHIFAIYGFVRYADEIVDTFHDYDKRILLNRFKQDTYLALEEGLSLNPILHSFQLTVKQFGIGNDLIDAFMHSMEMDLQFHNYKQDCYEEYIYGSAEVVGLMCLKVFCEGDNALYQNLVAPARSLGAAFQKVNFLRDLRSDFDDRGRVYFPNVDFENFCDRQKEQIEEEISIDFQHAFSGIKLLPKKSRFGVYLAYKYYIKLFDKIKSVPAVEVKQARIRVSNPRKLALWAGTYVNSNVLGVYTP